MLFRSVLRNDLQLLTNWVAVPDFVIADEATQIKSMRAKRSQVVKRLAHDVPYRYALTGQPIENRPEELYSIMQFVDPKVLGPFPKFDKTFIERDHWGRPVKYRNLDTMRRSMASVMYRKSRRDIEQYLPKIIPMELPVELPPDVRTLYDFIARDCLIAIEVAIEEGALNTGWDIAVTYGKADKPQGNKAMGNIMARLTCMRMLCDSPALLRLSADQYDDPESDRGAKYASWLKAEGHLDGLADTTKLDACLDQVEEIVAQGPESKVVVFSFFKPMLRMLRAGLRERKIQAALLTGDMNARARQESLHWLQHHGQVLLSSDAGQYGIDLPFCNYLVSYDLPWSAGAFAQRTARIDRTSSVFPHVTVITMMAKRTVEQRQFDMLTQKRMVAEAWVDGQHIDAKGALTLTLETLRSFLEDSVAQKV